MDNQVFMVDDNQDFLDMMEVLLRTSGYQVTLERSSLRALERIPVERPSLVLLDIMMPGMDGLELLKRLRAMPELDNLRIVVISGKPYEFDRKRALSFGADAYFVKPINTTTFVKELEHSLQEHIEMTFWGVRGTLPVGGEKTIRYGSNTNCVTLSFPREAFIILDAGTGIKRLSDQLIAEKRYPMEAKIFISHPHWDHINAFPFFGPLYRQGNEFEVCGPYHGDITTRELISSQMDGVFFPIKIKEFGARVYFRDLMEGAFEPYPGIQVRTMLLNHPGNCLGYRIEQGGHTICYITDNELYPPTNPHFSPDYRAKLIQFVSRADALIIDSTYTDEEYRQRTDWGHSSISQVVELAHDAKVKTLYLYHHDPDQDDGAIDHKLALAKAKLEASGSATVCLAPKEGETFRI